MSRTEVFNGRQECGREMMHALWANPEWRNEALRRLRGRTLGSITKAKISEASKERFRTDTARDEMSSKKGGLRRGLLPLVRRGINTQHISRIFKIHPNKVENFKRDLKRSGIESRKALKEETSLERRKTWTRKKRLLRDSDYAFHLINSWEFAGKAAESGFFGYDLSFWDQLKRIYQTGNRDLPEEDPDSLRLEFFLAALLNQKKGNLDLMSRYNSIGNKIDRNWFSVSLGEEEEFICKALNSVAEVLPKSFDKYSPYMQRAISDIDSLDIPQEKKFDLWIQWIAWLYGQSDADIAERLGIQPSRVAEALWRKSEEADWAVQEKFFDGHDIPLPNLKILGLPKGQGNGRKPKPRGFSGSK